MTLKRFVQQRARHPEVYQQQLVEGLREIQESPLGCPFKDTDRSGNFQPPLPRRSAPLDLIDQQYSRMKFERQADCRRLSRMQSWNRFNRRRRRKIVPKSCGKMSMRSI